MTRPELSPSRARAAACRKHMTEEPVVPTRRLSGDSFRAGWDACLAHPLVAAALAVAEDLSDDCDHDPSNLDGSDSTTFSLQQYVAARSKP